ncbi:hypothetical protein [Oceanitalea stevensii]|uniref:Uncharacterized protein n=1 Tax=Oceanitalea stevensii TaxID=2763072 RepID=A0ABR8Z650_9MICO|nr:hypothetical protein [Oceanitalea stevensii]MBD8063818.1 hypothetical protein [Oceanitalea stevensii]
MKKRPNLTYLIIAFTFGVVGISGLASGRSELLAFLVLAAASLIIGTDGVRVERPARIAKWHWAVHRSPERDSSLPIVCILGQSAHRRHCAAHPP